jgi:hypothetical protein
MALHCPATVFLAEEGVPLPPLAGLAGTHGPWDAQADVMAEIQAVADLHRGERVLVTLAPGGTAHVLRVLGRVVPDDEPGPGFRLEVGDDGWVVLPWEDGATG